MLAFSSLLQPKYWDRIKETVSPEDVVRAYNDAMFSMARLNMNAAKLMQKYKANCATDVTGFGILGHATNLVGSQEKEVDFVIHTLPIIANMAAVYRKCGVNFKLLEGYSAETSGWYILSVITRLSLYFTPLYALGKAKSKIQVINYLLM